MKPTERVFRVVSSTTDHQDVTLELVPTSVPLRINAIVGTGVLGESPFNTKKQAMAVIEARNAAFGGLSKQRQAVRPEDTAKEPSASNRLATILERTVLHVSIFELLLSVTSDLVSLLSTGLQKQQR